MKNRVIWYFIFLAVGIVLAFLLLAGLAFVLYKFRIDAKIAQTAVIGIHIIVPFMIGLLNGKKMKEKKYLWGLLSGMGYFVFVFIVSLIIGMNGEDATQIWKVLAITVAAGTIGGMLG